MLNQRIQMKIEEEENKYFKDEEQRRMKVSNRNRSLIIMAIVLVCFLVLSLFFSYVPSGGTNSVSTYISSIMSRFEAFGSLITGGTNTQGIQFSIVRYLVITLVGAALACCGAVYQGAFRNPIASPTTLGVSAGGSAAGTIYILYFLNIVEEFDFSGAFAGLGFLQRYTQSFVILVGCFVGVFLIIGIATLAGKGKVSTIALLLSGSIFGSLLTSVTGLMSYKLMVYSPEDPRVDLIRTVMLGTFNNAITWEHLFTIGIPILICLAFCFISRARINLLAFGEDEAKSMGLRVGFFRNGIVAVCTIMTAVCISFCGQIGFVGLIVPHIVRRIVGPDFQGLVPASMMAGSLLLLLSYDIAIAIGYSVNMNVVTSVTGGVVFLLFLIATRRKKNADWA